MRLIDLNSDLGESFGRWTLGDDAAVMERISSANVACGFHAGDPTVIRRTCRDAVANGVVVGAHPSYRDLAGFGRRFIDVVPAELTNEIIAQVGVLQGLASVEGTRVRYVKPHGALYNAVVHHEGHARALVEAIVSVDKELPLIAPPTAVSRHLAEAAGLRVVTEVFADRAYAPDGTLVSRAKPDSIIEDPSLVEIRVEQILEGYVMAIDGSRIDIAAETICLHSDTLRSVQLASVIRNAVDKAGVKTRSFVD